MSVAHLILETCSDTKTKRRRDQRLDDKQQTNFSLISQIKNIFWSKKLRKEVINSLSSPLKKIQNKNSRTVSSQLRSSDYLPILLQTAVMSIATECRKRACWNFKKVNEQKLQLFGEDLYNYTLNEDINKSIHSSPMVSGKTTSHTSQPTPAVVRCKRANEAEHIHWKHCKIIQK